MWPFREFVRWNPADDALVHLRVLVARSSEWQVSGALLDVNVKAAHAPTSR